MLAARRGVGTILGVGVGTSHGLRPDEGDDVEAGGTTEVAGAALVAYEIEGIPKL